MIYYKDSDKVQDILKRNRKNKRNTIGIYIHGSFERDALTDLPVVDLTPMSWTIFNKSVHLTGQVEVYNWTEVDGVKRDVIIYAWDTGGKYSNWFDENGDQMVVLKGLIVYTDDEESIKYAKQCMKERKVCL